VFEDGGRVEMGVNAISRVICMLVKSLETSFSTSSGDKVWTLSLSPHLIPSSSSSNLSLPIPKTCILYALFDLYSIVFQFLC
jgi:hypothetical protein